MFKDKQVLAVVTARSGSKGIPDKNMQPIGGKSLIAWAGMCLSQLPWLDTSVISTDSPRYAEEAKAWGIASPFLRPDYLSSDTAGSIETVTHALQACEKIYTRHYDIILIIEPTSPLRQPEDIEAAVSLLIETEALSVVTVSPLDPKFHPAKILTIADGSLGYYEGRGKDVVYRQSLEPYYWRNGVCYALTRDCLLEHKAVFTTKTAPLVIERPLVNIDFPHELALAEYWFTQGNRMN